jgi:site-specific DNA-methyltransferase (adenine-specific)
VKAYKMSGTFELFRGDAVEWLRSLPPASVDLVVTDPPYESLEKHRAVGTTTRLTHSKSSSNDWFTIFPNMRFPDFFEAVYRALKKNAHFYLFCDPETMFVARPLAEASGFKFWKPLIWDKRKIGMGYHYRARYECILFFEKGKRRLADLGTPDVIEVPRVHNGYPTEKPVAVGDLLVRQSSLPGELVADPFMGSGSFGVASVAAGRHFAGNDISKKACRLAQARIMDLGSRGGMLPVRTQETWGPSSAVRKIAGGEAACLPRFDRGLHRRQFLCQGNRRLH